MGTFSIQNIYNRYGRHQWIFIIDVESFDLWIYQKYQRIFSYLIIGEMLDNGIFELQCYLGHHF